MVLYDYGNNIMKQFYPPSPTSAWLRSWKHQVIWGGDKWGYDCRAFWDVSAMIVKYESGDLLIHIH